MPLLQLRSELRLDTRCERQVANQINRESVRAGDTLHVNALRDEFGECTHRPVSASRKYNCHGLTFASRRTWIDLASEVLKIIQDDEYEKVEPADVLPGDLAVYFRAGDVEHSGVVVRIDRIRAAGFGEARVPVIVSKWGACHEVIHRVADCPYYAGDVRYYRIAT